MAWSDKQPLHVLCDSLVGALCRLSCLSFVCICNDLYSPNVGKEAPCWSVSSPDQSHSVSADICTPRLSKQAACMLGC